jgi:hypothetical protein
MTTFLRLVSVNNKGAALLNTARDLRLGVDNARVFRVEPESFLAVPGAPFAYWASGSAIHSFKAHPPFQANNSRSAQQGASTKDDFRFLRLWWELEVTLSSSQKWIAFSKGGDYSKFYIDTPLLINWGSNAQELEASLLKKFPYLGETANWVIHRECSYRRPGISWSGRSLRGLSFRALPAGVIFSDIGPAAFCSGFDVGETSALLALSNSKVFESLVGLQISAARFQIGAIQNTPVPLMQETHVMTLGELARRAWSLKRTSDTVEETSHAFVLPAALRARLGKFDPSASESELSDIQAEIDSIAFDLYGFSADDRAAVQASQGAHDEEETEVSADEEADDDGGRAPIDQTDGLLSWAAGVAFGRFDWQLATGERATPTEPEPFDPLPTKSPGRLPDGAAPFHLHAGILVDDAGHPHDLVRVIEGVLARVNVSVPGELRRWLQREFFSFHLLRYSKSRRKAPIYWPLSTISGNYTLWVYYPSLTSQTLYTAINDFVEPRLKQVGDDVAALRNKGGARSHDDEKQFEVLQVLETELLELRDKLKEIAPSYKPNHDDGVQISAAPLWQLFRHKPWQKVLKDTWSKLEKGEYDWAQLAMAYWPDRVREKCKTDKSLAIAHGLEDLYVKPETAPKKTRGRKKVAGAE